MDHPWRRLRGLTDWTVQWCQLKSDKCGDTDFSSHTIYLDANLNQVERRCALAHELVHVARGQIPADPDLAAREEAAVEQETARQLIDLPELVDAIKWATTLAEAADILWVTIPVLQNRLDHLHPAERSSLKRQLLDPAIPRARRHPMTTHFVTTSTADTTCS
ncbi:ImmA/IrrE family metallo-endopeptidase [Propionibacterium freudenreichii]|uniref:ImmA/IrrE family metallo-endopeptidase n=1 Tax=Propionibacterium freudenreichii TaxID=1744 RepID=UPI003852B2E7